MKRTANLLLIFFGLVVPAFAGPLDETRYCGAPARDAQGQIIRRADVLRAFERAHPCPAPVGEKVSLLAPRARPVTSNCPGWYRDHVIPLACGGCDAVSNLQWLPEAQWKAKSRFERKIYAPGGGACP